MALFKNILGKAISTTGSILGLPEFGISEAVTGQGPAISSQAVTRQPVPSALESAKTSYANMPTGTGTIQPTSNIDFNAPQAPSEGDFFAALDAEFNPAFESLNVTEQRAREDAPIAEDQIRTSYQQALGPLEENRIAQENLLGEQTRDVETGREDAISSARRQFQELTQANLARFGAGTSASGAQAELLGREIARSIGGTRRAATEALGKLQNEGVRLTEFVGRQKINLEQKMQDAIGNVQREFRDKIDEINSQRGQLESQKAQARQGVLVAARNRAFEIQDAADAFKRELELFNKEKAAQLQAQFQSNQGISAKALAAFVANRAKVGTEAAISGVSSAYGTDPELLRNLSGEITPQTNLRPLGNGIFQNIDTGETFFANEGTGNLESIVNGFNTGV